MSEIWNLSTLCRCCHADGYFKSLKLSYQGKKDVEIYEILLRETLGISILTPQLEASYTICENCITRLRDATEFKNQVLMCEEKFKIYCNNEQFLATQDVKLEEDSDANNRSDIDDDPRTETETSVEYGNIKKEYTIEVDIANPIEESEKGKTTEEKKYGKTEISDPNKSINKTKNKKDPTNKNNNKKEVRRVRLDRSLIIQVDTDSGTQYSCKDCGGCYHTEKEIKRHIYLNHATVFKCEYCPKELKSLHSYKNHLKLHTGKDFLCPYCPKKLSGKYALNQHINSHTKEREFQCDLCKKYFMHKQTLLKHLRVHEGTNKKKLCDLCGRSFNDQSNLNAHIRSVHEKLRPNPCKICGKSYSNKRHLNDHVQLRHGSGGDKLFKCDICGHRLSCQKKMEVHRLKHDNKFMCHVCCQIFDDARSRREHVKSLHHKQLPCPTCGKIFTCKYSLNRHINDHIGIKKFSCDVCGFKFSQKSCLQRHVFRKHNPNAEFEKGKTKCDICKRSYKNISVHLDGHHNKRCACEICGKRYVDNSALNRHKAIKHFGRTFSCDLCDKKYVQRAKLNTHRLKVHKVKIEENCSESAKSVNSNGVELRI